MPVAMSDDTIDPTFIISEKKYPLLANQTIGTRLKAIINYKVIEKTRSFTIIQINYIFSEQIERKF